MASLAPRLAQRQLRRILFGNHRNLLAIDDDGVACGFDLPGIDAMHGVVLEKVSQRLCVGEVVDADELERGATPCPHDEPANTPESVNSDPR